MCLLSDMKIVRFPCFRKRGERTGPNAEEGQGRHPLPLLGLSSGDCLGFQVALADGLELLLGERAGLVEQKKHCNLKKDYSAS